MIVDANDKDAGQYLIKNKDTGEYLNDVVWCDTKKGKYIQLVRNRHDQVVVILGEALTKQCFANIELERK